ncbi:MULTISPECIES: hypothetical protein [unclassified Nonomuraea]|uniref:hypothetical protein n=1 Tax=unclassified Nonomuraea TaxID=2593643 RepID=UPI00340E8708
MALILRGRPPPAGPAEPGPAASIPKAAFDCLAALEWVAATENCLLDPLLHHSIVVVTTTWPLKDHTV